MISNPAINRTACKRTCRFPPRYSLRRPVTFTLASQSAL